MDGYLDLIVDTDFPVPVTEDLGLNNITAANRSRTRRDVRGRLIRCGYYSLVMALLHPSDDTLLTNKWMSVRVTRSIAAAPDIVWAPIEDEASWLSWYTPLSTFGPIGEPTAGVGAVFREQDWLWKTESEIIKKGPGHQIGLSTNSLNLPGLLRQYYRDVTVEPEADGSSLVAIAGGFTFGPLGWLLFPYTYPQMQAALYFEYRSALKGLNKLVVESIST